MRVFDQSEISTMGYLDRSHSRQITLMKSTMELVQSFLNDGDDLATAEDKVKQLSDEITQNSGAVKFDFVLGNVQPLKDAVQNSVLAFMTQAKKDVVLNILNQAV